MMFVRDHVLTGRAARSPNPPSKGLAAAYGNIGYMGPGLALIAFGRGGGRAGGADLLLRERHAFRRRAHA
jgi:hypothetical protein